MGVSGPEIKAGVKKASAWATPVACGANNGVLLTGDNLKKAIESILDDSLGMPFSEQRDMGQVKVEGSLNAFMRYDGLDTLIALAMGATGGAPTQQGTTTAYAQKFTLSDILDGLFATVAINKKVNVFEYPSVKVSGWTLRAEMGKPVEIDFDVIADNEDFNSSINNLTSFANVTYFEKENRILMSQGVFRLNDKSGAALADGDKVYPSGFELSYKRKVTGAYIVGQSNRIDEPQTDGLPEVKLKLTFPRYTATTYLSALGSDTRKKMDIVFTGSLIEATYYRTFKLQFPHLALLNAEAVTDKGQVKHPLEFECLATPTAPTGMTGILKPFQVDVINRQSSNVLS
ncbi:MAG: hypothetical protein HY805_00320 [Nitrospirae bacterium]|nr:hypothetical protein [Nitrospirota bacterium]